MICNECADIAHRQVCADLFAAEDLEVAAALGITLPQPHMRAYSERDALREWRRCKRECQTVTMRPVDTIAQRWAVTAHGEREEWVTRWVCDNGHTVDVTRHRNWTVPERRKRETAA